MNSIPCAPFCGQSCKEVIFAFSQSKPTIFSSSKLFYHALNFAQKVREKLEKTIIGKKNKLDEGFSWTLLHRMDDNDHNTSIYLHDTYERTLCHSKLALALRLMEDCFEPIVDRHTRIDLIPSVVYNNE